jgi:hypothetical protein
VNTFESNSAPKVNRISPRGKKDAKNKQNQSFDVTVAVAGGFSILALEIEGRKRLEVCGALELLMEEMFKTTGGNSKLNAKHDIVTTFIDYIHRLTSKYALLHT